MSDSDANSNSSIETPQAYFAIFLLISAIGLLVSSYATYHHLLLKVAGATDAICNINATLNCDTIAKSQYSEIFGVPLGVFGIAFFLSVLATVGLTIKTKGERDHRLAFTALSVIGAVVSVVLFGISSLKIGAYCPTCIVIYSLCALQILIALPRWGFWSKGLSVVELFRSGTVPFTITALTFAAYLFAQPSIQAQIAASAGSDKPVPSKSEFNAIPALTIPLSLSAYAGLGEDYRRGNENAKVVIVEFADFQCPACGVVAPLLGDLEKAMGDRLLVVYKTYPLDKSCNSNMQTPLHEFACEIAAIARCAGRYGKFWEYHDLAYKNQQQASHANARAWAKQVGLSDAQVEECLKSGDIMLKIKDDIALGEKLGVTGTPSLFINGRLYTGPKSYDALRGFIEDLLSQ